MTKAKRPSYSSYIRSPEWRSVRAKVMARAGGVCEGCHAERALHVHHRTYARLGNEAIEDLEALCPGCHLKEHPNKTTLQGAFLGDAECPCGSTSAEIYVGDEEVIAVCIDCGETCERRHRPRRGKRSNGRGRRAQEKRADAKLARERRRLAANMRKAAARIDRRHRRGGKAFGEF